MEILCYEFCKGYGMGMLDDVHDKAGRTYDSRMAYTISHKVLACYVWIGLYISFKYDRV